MNEEPNDNVNNINNNNEQNPNVNDGNNNNNNNNNNNDNNINNNNIQENNNNEINFEAPNENILYLKNYTKITISFLIILLINLIIEIYSYFKKLNYRKYVFQYAPIYEKKQYYRFIFKLFYTLWYMAFNNRIIFNL